MKLRQAMEILGLQIPFTADNAKTAYRKFAKIRHPDKGGSCNEFNYTKQAYEVCKCGVSFGDYYDTSKEKKWNAPTITNDGIKEFFSGYNKRKQRQRRLIGGVVSWFSKRMIAKLRAKSEKGATWKRMRFSRLLGRLHEETIELSKALSEGEKENIINECCDVAAFAMFIADNARRKLK